MPSSSCRTLDHGSSFAAPELISPARRSSCCSNAASTPSSVGPSSNRSLGRGGMSRKELALDALREVGNRRSPYKPSAANPKAAILDDPEFANNRFSDCRRRDLGDRGKHDELALSP